MGDFKTLQEEMKKLQKQIKIVLQVSDYRDCDDLSGLKGYEQIKTADERQRLEEYRNILYKLDEIQSNLAYYDRPIREMGKLHLNSEGRYETDKGYYYTSGSGIEFLRTEEVLNYDTQEWEKVEIWTASRVESNNGYYIVGYPHVSLDGLKVRIRA